MVAAGHHTPEIARHVEAAVREVAAAQGRAARRRVTPRSRVSRTRMIVLRLVVNSRATADTAAPSPSRRFTLLR